MTGGPRSGLSMTRTASLRAGSSAGPGAGITLGPGRGNEGRTATFTG